MLEEVHRMARLFLKADHGDWPLKETLVVFMFVKDKWTVRCTVSLAKAHFTPLESVDRCLCT